MTAIMPPLVIDVHVRERDSREYRIWFPFVILWPLLLLIVVFAATVTILVDLALILANARYHHYTALLFRTLQLLAAVRGTRAHVNNPTTLIDIDIY